MPHWIETETRKPPTGVAVETKIDDRAGCRNEQRLVFDRNLWWLKDRSMYVYYTPTHWKPTEDNHDND